MLNRIEFSDCTEMEYQKDLKPGNMLLECDNDATFGPRPNEDILKKVYLCSTEST